MEPPATDTCFQGSMTRRSFLESAAIAGGAILTTSFPPAATKAAGAPLTIPLTLRINGRAHALELDPRATLVDTLGPRLGLTGTKKGCDRGECGACTVNLDGRRVLSCMTLAAMHDGQEVTTIEGLAGDGELP